MNRDELALRSALLHVLSSPPVWKIDFWLGPVHVDGVGFFNVVFALTYGKIDVAIGPTVAGAAAEYHPDDNQYVFPFKGAALSPIQKMAIVHESVHAMLDIKAGLERKTFKVLQVENEAAAYVAQALYGVYAFDAAPGPTVSAYYDKAFEVANKIKDQRGARVSDEDAQYIKHAVAVAPLYYKRLTESSPAHSNGVW